MPDLILDRPYRLQELVTEMKSVSTFPPDPSWKPSFPVSFDGVILYDDRPWYYKREIWIRVLLGLIAIAGWLH